MLQSLLMSSSMPRTAPAWCSSRPSEQTEVTGLLTNTSAPSARWPIPVRGTKALLPTPNPHRGVLPLAQVGLTVAVAAVLAAGAAATDVLGIPFAVALAVEYGVSRWRAGHRTPGWHSLWLVLPAVPTGDSAATRGNRRRTCGSGGRRGSARRRPGRVQPEGLHLDQGSDGLASKATRSSR